MATKKWIGGATPVAQLTTITYSTIGSANTYRVICNGKTVTFLSTTANAADIYAGVAAACTAAQSTNYEFKDFVASSDASGVYLTSSTAGVPFTVTASASAGSATVTETTSATGPNHFDNAANWEGGVAPSAADDLELDLSTYGILYALSPGVKYASIKVTAVGQIGLPVVNGNGYREYRTRFLTLTSGGSGSITVTVQKTASFGQALMNLSLDSLVMTGKVYYTGQSFSSSAADYPLTIKNPGTNSTLFVQEGVVFVDADSAVTLTSVKAISSGSIGSQNVATVKASTTINCGAITVSGSSAMVTLLGAASSADVYDRGTFNAELAATCPTIKVNNALVNWGSSAGITTTLDVYALGEVNFTDAGSKAVAAANVYSGGIVNDPIGSVTWTTGIRLAGCRAKDVSIDIGVHKVLTPS